MTAEDFKKEVLPLKDKIFRFAKRLMQIHAEAEDMTQEVFIKLWNKKHELRQLKNVEAYAMTITKNLCLDKIKSRKATLVEFPAYELPNHDSNPIHQSEITNHKALMNSIINRLPDHQKKIMQLREIEGYEFEEIESITGININSIRVNLSRARKTIKEELIQIYSYGLEKN